MLGQEKMEERKCVLFCPFFSGLLEALTDTLRNDILPVI